MNNKLKLHRKWECALNTSLKIFFKNHQKWRKCYRQEQIARINFILEHVLPPNNIMALHRSPSEQHQLVDSVAHVLLSMLCLHGDQMLYCTKENFFFLLTHVLHRPCLPNIIAQQQSNLTSGYSLMCFISFSFATHICHSLLSVEYTFSTCVLTSPNHMDCQAAASGG